VAELEIGVVAALYRYPVKSMQGEALQSAALRWTGLDGDRQYAFYRAADKGRFPWHTGREMPELVRHVARYADPADPRKSPLQVTTPDGAAFDIASEDLRRRLSAAAGEDVQLMQVGRGTFDSGAVSVVSTATEAKLDAAFGAPLGLRRFRPNIVIRSGKAETEWLGGTLVFGDRADSARLRLNRPIERCVFVTIDPDTAAKDVRVMRMVAQDFNNEVGAYGATDAAGTIALGDRVRLMV
jgi:MOSC domain-containing protein